MVHANRTVQERIARGELPAILSSDTSAASDIWGFFTKMPDNLWWMFYDPARVNVDDAGRLIEKALKTTYRPALSFLRATAWHNPRFRKEGIDNLRAMDLDSTSYIEPILYHSDHIIEHYLDPFFDGNNPMGVVSQSRNISQRMKNLAQEFSMHGASKVNTGEYNALIDDLHTGFLSSHDDLKKMNDAVKAALAQLDEVVVIGNKKSLKRERVKALREHLLRIQQQTIDIAKNFKETQDALQNLAKATRYDGDQFGTKLNEIAQGFEEKSENATSMARHLSDQAYARHKRMKRVRDKDGRIVEEAPADVAEYRKTKLAIDVQFIPTAPNTLGTIQSGSIDSNAENYFIMAVDYAMNNVFNKETGEYIEYGSRSVRYGDDLGEFIAKMYAEGNPEDALYAIQLLKMAEGKESQQVFPGGFQDIVKKHIATAYGVNANELDKHEHTRLFLSRVQDISTTRDHSPIIWGPRDTKKRYYDRMRKYIYGRMYPSSDGFVATPLHNELIQHPLIKMRSRAVAHITGGAVVPLADTGRSARAGNRLEEEIGLAIQRKWWWAKKRQPTEEEPKPKGNGFIARSPFWVKAPLNVAQLAAIPAAAAMVTGGFIAPAAGAAYLTAGFAIGGGAVVPVAIAVPILAVGAVGAARYSVKTAKGIWAIPLVNRTVKKTLKVTAITAGTAGAVYLLAPFAPAIGAWGWALALANPGIAAGVASPFVALTALKVARIRKDAKSRVKDNPITFGEHRDNEQIPDDPFGLNDDQGEMLLLTPVPEVVEIELNEGSKAQEQQDFARQLAQEMMDQFTQNFAAQMNTQNQQFSEQFRDTFKDTFSSTFGDGGSFWQAQNTQAKGRTSGADDYDDTDFEDVIAEADETEDESISGSFGGSSSGKSSGDGDSSSSSGGGQQASQDNEEEQQAPAQQKLVENKQAKVADKKRQAQEKKNQSTKDALNQSNTPESDQSSSGETSSGSGGDEGGQSDDIDGPDMD